jgi:bacillolysin
MKRPKTLVSSLAVVLLALLLLGQPTYSATPVPPGVSTLERDALGEMEVTWDTNLNKVSFVRGRLLFSTFGLNDPTSSALGFIGHYADVFGAKDPSTELTVTQIDTDSLGMTHITLHQVYQGVEVYDAQIKMHLSAGNKELMAASNGFVPGIILSSVQPQVTSDQAVTRAKEMLPTGAVTSGPRLVIYPGPKQSAESAHLAWLVELKDDAIPAHNMYVVDAIAGEMLDVLNRLYDVRTPLRDVLSPQGRSREVYSANHTQTLPGVLVRTEGQGSTGDADADHAYDFTGDTYNYYKNTFGRDSYDNNGAALVSTVHYGSNYMNAFWNGSQMVYGDGLPVKDVTAHELTHAVTEHTANLEYRAQSGALNESFSDIFGVMVDRDDWLIGEELPASILGGKKAIRDMADPASLGQSAHVQDWVKTCSDDEGVHTNSGIPNKAYYNIATVISKEKAERIFYRALTTYLQPTSSLEDARAAALQSAHDLYGSDSVEYKAVQAGFNDVGLDGAWTPPTNECGCGASVAMAGATDEENVLDDLRAVRDQVFNQNPGKRWVKIYYDHELEVAWLLIKDSQLRADALAGFRAFDPVFRAGLNNDPNAPPVILTPDLVESARRALMGVAEESSPEVHDAILSEWNKVNPYRFIGWDVRQVWDQLRREQLINPVFLPVVLR